MNFNRDKIGCTLNLKAPEGKELFKEMAKKADVVIENYRPGTMEKLGLGYDVLKEINPRLVYGAVSGFGHTGPYHQRAGYDIVGQAMATEYSTASARDVLAQFSDYVKCSGWALPSLAFCYDKGILDSSALTIQPSKAILRCEVAQMLYNMDAQSCASVPPAPAWSVMIAL